jgi:hypothetical protein
MKKEKRLIHTTVLENMLNDLKREERGGGR